MHFSSPNTELAKNVVSLPQSNRNFPDWIRAYMDFCKGQEASAKIHLWSAVAAIAGAAERKVWMDRAHFMLYPNLYIFIVGPSGIFRKSTSTGIAMNMLKEIPSIKMMSDRVTAGSLIDQLAVSKQNFEWNEREYKHHSMVIYASELIVFVKEVFGSVTELLTTFWDSPQHWKYQTKSQGTTKLQGVCLNMLAATTIEWLRQGITTEVMNAGFAGRVIFVCDKKGPDKYVAFPSKPKDFESVREKLMEDLMQIHFLMGEFQLSEEMKAAFESWYEPHMREARDNEDTRLNGYNGRKHDFILKLCMIKSLSESDHLNVEKEHFDWALEQMNLLEPDLEEIYKPLGSNYHSDIELNHFVMSIVEDLERETIQAIESEILKRCEEQLDSARLGQCLKQLLKERRLSTFKKEGSTKTHYRRRQ